MKQDEFDKKALELLKADKVKEFNVLVLKARYANLRGANLSGANLSYANLRGADLREADLSGANLRGANLSGANLSYANLSGANLSYANLSYANLSGADLSEADLSEADLRYADLREADLSYADLSGANLRYANLDYQIQDGLLLKVAKAALATPEFLKMDDWHTCDTTHCIAGWAAHLDPTTKALCNLFGNQVGALLTLGEEAHRYFFKGDDEAREFLQSLIDREAVKNQGGSDE